MGITISDIEQKEFAYKGAGYDPYDVDQYLDQICDEMVSMQDRINQLEADLAKAQMEAQNAANRVMPQQAEPEEAAVGKTSETLEGILLNAQKLADGAIQDAKRKADDIVKAAESRAEGIVANAESALGNARDQAEGIIADAKEEKITLEKSVETLHTAADDFKKNFLTLIEEQKELLDGHVSLFSASEESTETEQE